VVLGEDSGVLGRYRVERSSELTEGVPMAGWWRLGALTREERRGVIGSQSV
jgi:hypothetical protein